MTIRFGFSLGPRRRRDPASRARPVIRSLALSLDARYVSSQYLRGVF